MFTCFELARSFQIVKVFGSEIIKIQLSRQKKSIRYLSGRKKRKYIRTFAIHINKKVSSLTKLQERRSIDKINIHKSQ